MRSSGETWRTCASGCLKFESDFAAKRNTGWDSKLTVAVFWNGPPRCHLCHLCEKGHLCAAPRTVPHTRTTARHLWQATSCMASNVIYVMYVRKVIYGVAPCAAFRGASEYGKRRHLWAGAVTYARNVIYEAAVARTASSASGVSTSSSAAVLVGTSATASW